MTEVCVDASLARKVVVPEAGSDKADALFDQWDVTELLLKKRNQWRQTGLSHSYRGE